MTEQTVKYTPEFTRALVEGYEAVTEGYEAEQAYLAEVAEANGFTVRELRAKLVTEKVYRAKAKAEAGKRAVRKAELVAQLAELVGYPEEVVETAEKANRKVLEIVVGRLRALTEAQEA